jgi:hypothetical protein
LWDAGHSEWTDADDTLDLIRRVQSREALGLERPKLSCCLSDEVAGGRCALFRVPMLMRAYLGVIGREGNDGDSAYLVDVASNRLQRGSPGLAVGSEPAGSVQNYSVRQDEVRLMSDEEFRQSDSRRMKMRKQSR